MTVRAKPELPAHRMTVDEYLAWAEENPGRYELVDGKVWAMSPERTGHARVKYRVQRALETAIGRAGLPCEMLPDGMTVRVDDATAYEPDALVYCGPRNPSASVEVTSPVIVVEVLSPSTQRHDVVGKLAGYFKLASVAHYLIVDSEREVVVHHAREGEASIRTAILGRGALQLDPPGLSLAVADFFEP
jgi:Uma2 family endonuclease